jgi:hypothetical protein
LLSIYYRAESLAAGRAMPMPYGKIRTHAELSTVQNTHDHALLALTVALPRRRDHIAAPLAPRAAGVAAIPRRQTAYVRARPAVTMPVD